MSEFNGSETKSKIQDSEQKSKPHLSDLISKTKNDSTPSPMKSQRLMQRRKEVGGFLHLFFDNWIECSF